MIFNKITTKLTRAMHQTKHTLAGTVGNGEQRNRKGGQHKLQRVTTHPEMLTCNCTITYYVCTKELLVLV